MKCQTSQLNDDLGLIDYIFSDKTGTLTKNNMKFKCLFTEGIEFGGIPTEPQNSTTSEEEWKSRYQEFIKTSSFTKTKILEIITCCHEVLLKRDPATGEKEFNASSPDELALLDFAHCAGFEFEGIDDRQNHIIVQNLLSGQQLKFERLFLFRFNSDRSRMSVVVRDLQDSKVYLLMKGADHVMIDRATRFENMSLESLQLHLMKYADVGLRTLVYSFKEISEEMLRELQSKMLAADKLVGLDKAKEV